MSKWQYPILRDNLSINIIGHTVCETSIFFARKEMKNFVVEISSGRKEGICINKITFYLVEM